MVKQGTMTKINLQDKVGMLCEVSETMSDEDDGLASLVLAKTGEELELAFWIKRRSRLIGNEKSYVVSHKPHEHP